MMKVKTEKKMYRYNEINTPDMVALDVGAGSASKLFQALMDNHSQIYMLPGFPLLYFYPHWSDWEVELADNWCWQAIVEKLMEKHPTICDTSAIDTDEGLSTLGDENSETITLNKEEFKDCLVYMLENESIEPKKLIEAVHYVYAILRGENISHKKVIFYHIHYPVYLVENLFVDCPDVKVITMMRDPRPGFISRYKAVQNGDINKLNATDVFKYRNRVYLSTLEKMFHHIFLLQKIPHQNVRVVRHEDLINNLETTMKNVASFLGIAFEETMLTMTMGGKQWWGASLHNRGMNSEIKKEFIKEKWEDKLGKIQWYFTEGLLFDLFIKYKYEPKLYTKDGFLNRTKLFVSLFLSPKICMQVFLQYLDPREHIKYITTALQEAQGKIATKDYSWNSTYKHKWLYKGLNLNVLNLERRILVTLKQDSLSPYLRKYYEVMYVVVCYLKYVTKIFLYFTVVFKRWGRLLTAYFRKTKNTYNLPDLV